MNVILYVVYVLCRICFWTNNVPSQFQGEIYGNHKYSVLRKWAQKLPKVNTVSAGGGGAAWPGLEVATVTTWCPPVRLLPTEPAVRCPNCAARAEGRPVPPRRPARGEHRAAHTHPQSPVEVLMGPGKFDRHPSCAKWRKIGKNESNGLRVNSSEGSQSRTRISTISFLCQFWVTLNSKRHQPSADS